MKVLTVLVCRRGRSLAPCGRGQGERLPSPWNILHAFCLTLTFYIIAFSL